MEEAMAEKFDLDIRVQELPDIGGIVIFCISGDLDRHNSEIVEIVVNKCYRQQQYHFIFDLAGTQRINSTGLGLLINIMHRTRQNDGSIHLVHVSVKINSLLNHLGVADEMGICDDLDQALAIGQIHSANGATEKDQKEAKIAHDQ